MNKCTKCGTTMTGTECEYCAEKKLLMDRIHRILERLRRRLEKYNRTLGETDDASED